MRLPAVQARQAQHRILPKSGLGWKNRVTPAGKSCGIAPTKVALKQLLDPPSLGTPPPFKASHTTLSVSRLEQNQVGIAPADESDTLLK